MANYAPGSLRAANVVCCPPLATILDRFAECFYVSSEGGWKPGAAEVSFDPSRWGRGQVAGPLAFGVEYLFKELLSKFDDGKPSPDKIATTWTRFREAENLCGETNSRLTASGIFGPHLRELHLARELLSMILGPFSWDAAATSFGWGPGASTRLPRRKADAAYKYMGNPHTTIGNAALADACIRSIPLWEASLSKVTEDEGIGYCKVVNGNRIVTVPKNYKTDRTIAIEPDMNMYVQKGIGTLMRRRLRRVGCDLDDQSRNQRLARVGSISGSLATIDLSMASDTVSRCLVSRLLPSDWLEALDQCRCPFGVLPSGEKIFYQKYSSMGNGFTFELESAIFYALCLACVHLHGEQVHRIAVYGDDLIVPSKAAESVIGLLQFCGFRANEKKSYSTGPFRESCGKHYFNGYDVTPFYIKETPRTLTDLMKLHNQVYLFALRADWLDSDIRQRLGRFCHWLRSYSPSQWRRPRLPVGYGDGAFIGTFDECVPNPAKGGLEGFTVKVMLTKAIKDEGFESPSLLLKSLDTLERQEKHRPDYLGRPELSGSHPVRGARCYVGVILVRRYAHLSPF